MYEMKMHHHYKGTLYNMDGTKLYNSLSIVTEIL